MNKAITIVLLLTMIGSTGWNCGKSKDNPVLPADSSYVNFTHLNRLYVPLTLPGGRNAAGIWIYSESPDYHMVEAAGEGYTCVDDVARAAMVYFRSEKFNTDTAIQNKVYNLIKFTIGMQSPNGYFYNFVYSNGLINKFGITSLDNANWWSWRALQMLTEAAPLIMNKDPQLYAEIQTSITNVVNKIKADLVNLPQTTRIVNGVIIPTWLPEGSGTDQAALLVIGLIQYNQTHNDPVISAYIRKLADGIVLMQKGNAAQFPYSSILSWENTWHAWGSDQSWALQKAGNYLQDTTYSNRGIAEVTNFYKWLLQSGMKSSFSVQSTDGIRHQLASQSDYEQIAYGIRPMVFAAIEAYEKTGNESYADIAGHLAAWFLGANVANTNMYDKATGRCFDAIATGGNVNRNSGAESTIEALMTFQRVEKHAAVLAALNRYKR